MAFERGSFGFRLFSLPRPLPEDAVDAFARNALSGLDLHSTQEEKTGWVTGRHMLDGQISEATALYGGYLRLALLHAIKKVPPTLLHAECRIEEMAQLAASGRDFLDRKVRKEIKDGIAERLLPAMPYQLSAIPMVYEPGATHLIAGALSEKQLDRFAIYFRYAMGFEVTVSDPDEIALRTRSVDPRQFHPSSFSPEVPDAMVENPIGQDFLTWLWFLSEAKGGTVEVPGEGPFSFMLQGPLTFVFEGSGAHETVLRKGEPLVSAEARTCLISGKKLRNARLLLARDEQQWFCTLNADSFTFRGVKLPDDDAMDPVGRFQERMLFLETLRKVFLHLYDLFLQERGESARWKPIQKEIHTWVKDRPTRK